MAKKIVWTKKANKSFNNVIAYLETEWGVIVAENFVIRTYDIVELLVDNYEIGSVEDPAKGIRGFLITKHNILFYRTTANELILLNLYDTRSHPGRLKY